MSPNDLKEPRPSSSKVQEAISARLWERRAEIEDAALTRVHAIADPVEAADPEYVEGLKLAVSAALEYGLEAVERGEEHAPPVPTTLLAQARLAARNRVSLDTVLRRYFTGYTLFGDFLLQEAERGGKLDAPALKRLLRTQASLFDRLVTAVSEEYARESASGPSSAEQRRLARVRRLLAGESLDTTSLRYAFDAWHVGLVAVGIALQAKMRDLAESLESSLLVVSPSEETVWVWLGHRRAVDLAELERKVTALGLADVLLTAGEPGRGLTGWRLTHRQAVAALTVALRGDSKCVRYADVILLASLLQDDLGAASLHQLYLAPLEAERDDGVALRETLRAYFTADRNVSSASAALGVSRQAVTKRLQVVEERIGHSLLARGLELEVALRLDELANAADKVQPTAPSPHHSGMAKRTLRLRTCHVGTEVDHVETGGATPMEAGIAKRQGGVS